MELCHIMDLLHYVTLLVDEDHLFASQLINPTKCNFATGWE